jgi:N,N'-diacetylbacillosaminyl-diphospho-undecaprenol alpha-1,3-N-acetylgalactosaminyltransferase
MVLNSSIEATSYSLLEARACGLPTIANTGTGATEIISNEIDGILCGSSTGFSLEPALKLLSENRDIAANYGLRARRDTIKRFSRKSIFEQILVHSTSDI